MRPIRNNRTRRRLPPYRQLQKAPLLAAFYSLLFLTLTPSLQADYQAGLNAYQSGDYDLAIREWQSVAESPPGTVDPAIRAETIYAIGMLFWLGQGVQQDTIESASWLKLAAEMSHAGAQTKLGYLYSSGQGVRQSDFEALKWWQMAANQGEADAQYNLGVSYRDGLGVEPDANQSLQWFREAAANGDPISADVIKNYEETGSLLTTNGEFLLPDEDGPPNPEKVLPLQPFPEITAAPSPDQQTSAEVPTAAMGEGWIRQRDPEHYTIQVIALRQPDKLQDYSRQHQDWAPFAVYTPASSSQTLWVLVQGDYADVELARQSVRDFPQDMQPRENLWIRKFHMVQGLLE